MALGQAQWLARANRSDGPVAILDKLGQPRWCNLWGPSTTVARPGQAFRHSITHGPDCRPYLDYSRTTPTRWAFRADHRPIAADLPWVSADARAQGAIVIDPTIKPSASPNKRWHGWQGLVDALPYLPWAQIGRAGTQYLNGVRPLRCDTFDEVLAVIRAAKLVVCHEGALHHAAAACGTLAVVLCGSYIPQRVTTYPSQVVIAVDDPEAVGWRVPNQRCEAAWQTITPDLVATQVKLAL
jgi:hypothetical protein